MPSFLRRVVYLFRQSRHDEELREEIEAHRELRAAQLVRDGLTPPEAAAASRRAIGNVLLARDDAREVWLGSADAWWQDVRYALRTLRKNPAFTTASVVTLALGIGVNAGMFSVVNAVLFRDLPAPRSHELVSISQSVRGVPTLARHEAFSTAEYFAYRDRARTLSGLAAYGNARGETTLGGDAPRKILGALVSCNYFDVLQQPPALGRAFAAGDCQLGADLVVVLTHELWRTAFAADRGIVGRTLQLNRRRVTVVGVTAAGTYNGSSFLGGGYLAPVNAGGLLSSDDSRYDDASPWLNLLGRRKDGVGLEQVQAEFAVLAKQIDQPYPGRSTVLTIERGRPTMPSQLRRAAPAGAALLMGAFGLILLIACANVANLLLARGTSRRQEIGIRVALGASRVRVVRQLMTESLLLSLAGGLLGSTIALWSLQALVTRAVPALLPAWFPLALTLDVSPDLLVIACAIALTMGAAMLFGLAPALHVSHGDVHGVTKQDSPGGGSSPNGRRLRGTLVGVQVALCMVLLIAAGLVLRGLHATYTTDPGFAYRDVAYVSLESAFDGYSSQESETTRRRLMSALAMLPGVEAVASTDQEPLGDDMAPVRIRLPGQGDSQSRAGELITASQDYFSVLELPIVRGRAFTQDEVERRAVSGQVAADGGTPPRPRPAIVSATTARNLWPGADPIGRTLLSENDILQVVGVAADAQLTALGQIDPYYVYVPGEGAAVLVKGRNGVATTIAGIRAAVSAIDPALLVTVLPLEATLWWSRGISATVTTIFGGLGVLALVLAAVGIYGVVAFAVAGRYREIGIRLALGATARSALGLVLRQTMRPVIAGAVVGVAAASALARILSSVLFGVSPADPFGLGGAVLVLLGVALAAALTAARPATRVDPAATLRCP